MHLTLQFVRPSSNGFKCRLWDFENDFTLERRTLEKLEDVVMLLVNEIEQPGRTLEEYREQMRRVNQLFDAEKRRLASPQEAST